MERNFSNWLKKFRESIADYAYYVDFQKVYRKVDSIKVELNIMNSLIGSRHIEKDFENLVRKYPEIIKCIPILLAVRKYEIFATDIDGSILYQFDEPMSISQCKTFMKKTGLFDLIAHHIVNNLVDYATGVETGLDSNGRKNRGGDLMENLVEKFIIKAGFTINQNYFKEMTISEIKEKWNIDLANISHDDETEKRFDFVIKTPTMLYGVEVNFYTSGGSKLNETARSYKTIALEAKDIPGFTFVWITDGKGWLNARNNLKETFDILDHLYSINDLENGVCQQIFK